MFCVNYVKYRVKSVQIGKVLEEGYFQSKEYARREPEESRAAVSCITGWDLNFQSAKNRGLWIRHTADKPFTGPDIFHNYK